MVYFLQPTDGGPIKIGYTDNLDQRRLQLQFHYGTPLALLATMDGGKEVERAIHERFAAHRIGRTEQFRPVPELLAFIDRPLLASPNPNAVEAITPHSKFSPTLIGLEPEQRAKAGRIKQAQGLTSLAAAIRWMIDRHPEEDTCASERALFARFREWLDNQEPKCLSIILIVCSLLLGT